MNLNSCLGQAEKMALKARPGILTINGNIYTFVFDSNRWLYNVYKNGFEFTNFNTKSLSVAKKYLVEYLNN